MRMPMPKCISKSQTDSGRKRKLFIVLAKKNNFHDFIVDSHEKAFKNRFAYIKTKGLRNRQPEI